MIEAELQQRIDAMKRVIRAEVVQTKNEEKFQEVMLLGIDILGELFMDIKRMAQK